MKRATIAVPALTALLPAPAVAQTITPGADQHGRAPLAEVQVLDVPALHIGLSRSLAEMDAVGPYRYADPFEVDANPGSHGVWETTPDGSEAVWRLKVASAGAVSLDLGFTRYRMPPGGRLRVYAPGRGDAIRPFTAADNEDHGQLWTPIIRAGEAMIEATVPVDRMDELELELGVVHRGFRDLTGVMSESHGSCHIDVACSQADGLRDQVRSVGLVTHLGNVCSGVLLNNTAEDGTPYFLTASRCGFTEVSSQAGFAAYAVFYWNYQSPTCGQRTGGSLTQFQTGARIRASSANTDFALLELNDLPDLRHDVHFAGWNRGSTLPTSTVGIHHPQAHVKSVAVDDDPPTLENPPMVTASPNSYLRVGAWDEGTTEAGSSGSPLFDQNGRVVGLLSSSASSCSELDESSYYGRLASAWGDASSPSSESLRSWLDPEGTAATTLDGRDDNRSPEVVFALPDKALRASDGALAGSLTTDVAYAFHDANGTALAYGASSSDTSKATVSVSGSELTISPVAEGTATITVTASDGDLSVTQTFAATVGENRSPEALGTLPALTFGARPRPARTVDLSSAFEDADVDQLTYGASASDPEVVRLEVSGSNLTVTTRRGRSTTVLATATDAAGSNTTAGQPFRVNVPNLVPVAVGSLVDFRLGLPESSKVRNVVTAFRDPDGDTLWWDMWSSNPAVVRVRVLVARVEMVPVAVGTATVTVEVRDAYGSNQTATQTFDVEVVDNNPPEQIRTLPTPLNLRLIDGAHEIDLSTVFRDPDDDLTYNAWVTPHDKDFFAVTITGSVLSITPRIRTRTSVWVTASDANFPNRTLEQKFRIHVVNSPPYPVGSLPDVEVRIGDPDSVVGLRTAFDDVDWSCSETSYPTCVYAASSSAPAVVLASVSGRELALTPVAFGTATVTVTARDFGGAYATGNQEFDVRVRRQRAVKIPTTALSVDEGSTNTYSVALNSEPAGTVTVTASVPSNRNLTLEPEQLEFTVANWQTPQFVTVTAATDTNTGSEPPVTISHGVSGADYGSIAVPSVRATIVEADTSVLSVEAVTARESAGAMAFVVRLNKAGASEITVDYATSDGSARAGTDFTATSGTLTFPANSTASRQVLVPVTDDSEDEDVEEKVFSLTLRNPRHASLAGGGPTLRVLGTIKDDDDPEVRVSFESPNYTVSEINRARVTVLLDQDPERVLEIPLDRTHLGGADYGDYGGVPESISFAPGVTRREFYIVGMDDEEEDAGESVMLTFGFLPPGVIGGGETVVKIDDYDGPGGTGRGDPNGGGGPPAGGGGGGGGGGGAPPRSDEGTDDRDGDDGGAGGGSLRAAITTDAACDGTFCRVRTGVRLSFRDASTGAVRSRLWDFGDGTLARSGTLNHAWPAPGFYQATLTVSDGTVESTASLTFLVEAASPAGTCVADERTRCLQDSRYAVTIDWWPHAGSEEGAEPGVVVRVGTNDSGMFRFFDPNNWEVLIKVLDGCSLNGSVWVFGASTTDLGFLIRVTDTASGAVREYRNEPGLPAAAITDAEAFAACPR